MAWHPIVTSRPGEHVLIFRSNASIVVDLGFDWHFKASLFKFVRWFFFFHCTIFYYFTRDHFTSYYFFAKIGKSKHDTYVNGMLWLCRLEIINLKQLLHIVCFLKWLSIACVFVRRPLQCISGIAHAFIQLIANFFLKASLQREIETNSQALRNWYNFLIN